jgi:hypothetical protein
MTVAEETDELTETRATCLISADIHSSIAQWFEEAFSNTIQQQARQWKSMFVCIAGSNR